MARTIHATFDGKVLRPEDASGFEPNRVYVLTVEESSLRIQKHPPTVYPLTTLVSEAMDLGVADLAERHDDYAHRR